MKKVTTALLFLTSTLVTANERLSSRAPSILEMNAHIDGIHRRAEQLQIQRENQRTLDEIKSLEEEQLENQEREEVYRERYKSD